MGEERHGLHGRLAERFGVAGDALYDFAGGLLKQPLLFPSLGPTALLFFESPMAARSSPRNTLIGHVVARYWPELSHSPCSGCSIIPAS